MNEAQGTGAVWRARREAEVEVDELQNGREAKTSSPLEALVTCANPEYLYILADLLQECGLAPILSSTVREAQAIMTRRPIHLVFCEDGLPDGSFHEILGATRRAATRLPVVVMSKLDDWDHYLRAMHGGAFDYIKCPPRRAEVEWVVHSALRATL